MSEAGAGLRRSDGRLLDPIRRARREVLDWVLPNLRQLIAARIPTVWVFALCVGVLVGVGAILFRLLIGWVQLPWLGVTHERLASAAERVPWFVILLAPAIGGLVVGWLVTRFLPGRRAEGVADVIEAQALGAGRLGLRKGLMSALVSAISLGCGASAGREGPVVHLGATIAAALARRIELPGAARRTLLGAGVAAAISASFNAPIAGVVFAHEVILGHYAASAFVPIVLSSVVGSVISRLYFGDFPAFIVPAYQITSYWEFPAFALLGIVCAGIAILFQMALMGGVRLADRMPVPLWARPALGGLMVGAIGVVFPQVLGVGYEATDEALRYGMTLWLMLALLAAKLVATAITLSARFGGGVFSPSLYLGAMTGGAFGIIAASVFPHLASSQGLYAILGMGAVAASVLGAPFSTTLIVFELTGGFALSIAILLTVSVASGLTQALHGRSLFQWQLETRGLFLGGGPHKRIVRTVRVRDFLTPIKAGEEAPVLEAESDAPRLKSMDTLEAALRAFDRSGESCIQVVDKEETRIIGHAEREQALRVYNAALIEASVEEHR